MKPIAVRFHERRRPEKPAKQIEMTERLLNEVVRMQCVMALESELAKLLPDYGRDDLDRLRETY